MKRRLSTILVADMVGYSRAMRADEEGTAAAFRAVLEAVIEPAVADNGGRIVKLTGDGVLAEFDSVVLGVSAALSIQQSMQNEAIEFRIGVNSGDVLIDGQDILGDGVNVAARLEGAAQPGGVCISDAVHEQVRDRLNVDFTSGGAVDLKNLGRPLTVWHWQAGGVDPDRARAAENETGQPVPIRKPSIAVLPFENLSTDEEQAVFADGMTEEITTALSRIPWFYVIARPSAAVYKDSDLGLSAIAHELHVTYLVVGSVRRGGARLRVSAQLIDARVDTQLWADRYDGNVEDIFDMQDEVTGAVVGAIAPEFLISEAQKAQRKDVSQLDAWECVMRGRALLWRMNREDLSGAIDLFQRAIAASPDNVFGAGDLVIALLLQSYYGWADNPEQVVGEMVTLADKAVEADPSEPWALVAKALASLFSHRWEAVLPAAERAVQVSPGFAPAIGVRGIGLVLLSQVQRGIDEVQRARRLSPRDGMNGFFLMVLFWGYFTLHDYDQALAMANEALRIAPNNPTFRRQRAAALSWLGREQEARAAIAAYLELAPGDTTASASRVPTPDTATIERFVEGLRRAGLPDPV